MSMNLDYAKVGVVLVAMALMTGVAVADEDEDTIGLDILEPEQDAEFVLGVDDVFDVEADVNLTDADVENATYTLTVYEEGVDEEDQESHTHAEDVEIEEDEYTIEDEIPRTHLDDLAYMDHDLELVVSLTYDEVDGEENQEMTESTIFSVDEPEIEITSPVEDVEIEEDEYVDVEALLNQPDGAEDVTVTLADDEEMDENTTTVELVDEELSELESSDEVTAQFGLEDIEEFDGDEVTVEVALHGENMTEDDVDTLSALSTVEVTDADGVLDDIIGDDNITGDFDSSAGGVTGIVAVFLLLGGIVVAYKRNMLPL